jgi:hypothetical protein
VSERERERMWVCMCNGCVYLGLVRMPFSEYWRESLGRPGPPAPGENVDWLTFSLKRSSHFMFVALLLLLLYL